MRGWCWIPIMHIQIKQLEIKIIESMKVYDYVSEVIIVGIIFFVLHFHD